MVPTRRLAALVGLATLVALVAGYVPAARPPLVALDVAIVLAAALDALALRGRRLDASRQVAAIFSVGRVNVVTVEVRNRSLRRVKGLVTDDPLDDAHASGIPARLDLPPRSAAVVRYEVVPTRRGAREFGAVTVRYGSPLGLVHRQEKLDLPAKVDVYPDVHAARALELLRRQGREDARLGSLRVRGGDTDFERLRPYQQGDEVRHVDWRATARRDDLTVRQFQVESNQNVVFALDTGRGMRGESGGLTSIDHALNAALLAADVALRAGDRAGLLAFDSVPRTFVAPTGGKSTGRKLARAAYALDASFAATDYRAAMSFLQTQVRARSLVVIFTNPLEARGARELASAVRSLLPRHVPLCVLLRDSDVEALATSPVMAEEDLYVRAAAAEALAWRDTLIRSLKKSGVLVLDARPDDVTPDLVKRYLEVKARRLL